jgi:hypothetical protein
MAPPVSRGRGCVDAVLMLWKVAKITEAMGGRTSHRGSVEEVSEPDCHRSSYPRRVIPSVQTEDVSFRALGRRISFTSNERSPKSRCCRLQSAADARWPRSIPWLSNSLGWLALAAPLGVPSHAVLAPPRAQRGVPRWCSSCLPSSANSASSASSECLKQSSTPVSWR